jgi:hypothetical protein
MAKKREAVVNQLVQHQKDCANFLNLMGNDQAIAKLRAEKLFTLPYLEEHYQVDLFRILKCD